jgi:hypothetical protein
MIGCAQLIMDNFPFTRDEWAVVSRAVAEVVQASMTGDEYYESAQFAVLKNLILRLRKKYGEHPVLLETEADFENDVHRQVALYERAIRIAVENALPSYSIRLSLARVLLDECDAKERALTELMACQSEALTQGDEHDRKEWRELRGRCAK